MTMSIDPLKLVTAAATPLIKAVGREYKLRGADEKSIAFAGVDAEMSAALDVLALNADKPGKALLDYLKGKISGRPAFFDEAPTAQWVSTEKIESLVKFAVRALIRGDAIQTEADEAAAFYAEYPEADGPGQGYMAFEYAVAFVALSITRNLTVGDRLVMEAIGGVTSQIADATAPIPIDLLDAHIGSELGRMKRSRFFEGSSHKADALRLANRIQTGDLARASASVRAVALANCARYLARDDDVSVAEGLWGAATALESSENAAIARAFLRARSDAEGGLAVLAPIDSPAKRTAALQIVLNRDGPEGMAAWADNAGIGLDLLDADGKHILLTSLMQAQRWDDAYAGAQTLTEDDFEDAPAARQAVAMALITHNVPADLRGVVASGTPLDAASFPLFDTVEAVRDRRAAAALLDSATETADRFKCDRATRAFENLALWLRLRDTDTRAEAREALESKLGADDPIAWVPLGLAFGISLDLGAVERALTRADALNPQGDVEIALARLALANGQATAANAADYLQKHMRVMLAHLNRPGILDIEIKMLTSADRLDQAQRRLDEADGIDDGERAKLQAIIATGATGPSIADLEAAYAVSPVTANLAQLVLAMSRQGYSERFFELARLLVTTTKARHDAESIVQFLLRHDRTDDVATVLGDVPELIDMSPLLRSAQAWTAYRAGDIAQATAVLTGLRAERDVADDRALLTNILITSGRWPDLSVHVEDEWSKRDSRTAEELLLTAQLAAQIGSSRVAGLIALAAEKAPADPEVLIGCYMLSTQQGLENADHVQQWFATAANLSGDDGPVQSADIEQLIDQAPDWDKRVSEAWDKLKAGDIPRYVAAKLLRRPSLELLLPPMLANRDEPDPRRRSVIPAYSGVRGSPDLKANSIALDGSSLIILASLDLIELVTARWIVTIAHSTLGWLFGERQRLAFHQPSRIAFAHRMSRALSAGRMLRFTPSTPVDEKLVDIVGRSLAAMLGEAQSQPGDEAQRIVVRSAPVQKVGSFRGEGVDLARFADHLVSCLAVVDKLVEAGQLTLEEEQRARGYLEANERRWATEIAIEDGAELYLDDLSVSYLNTAGVLDKIAAAGLKVFVSQHQVDEANALIGLESQATAIEAVIERLRAPLAAGIASGTVKLAASGDTDELKAHPDMSVIELAGHVDAIVSDDRYMNRHANIDSDNGASPVWTSLDLLAALRADNAISEDEHRRYLTTLRRSGLLLIPATAEELAELVARSRLKDGEMLETGELRAFRENLMMIQMRSWLRLPTEAEWLQRLTSVLVDTIGLQWNDTIADDLARARSRWLLARADMRNWSGMITDHDGSAMATYGLAIPVNSLLINRPQIEFSARDRFDSWMREEVLEPLKHTEPRIYAWLIDHVRQFILMFAEDAIGDD